jgi:hypothetical protein
VCDCVRVYLAMLVLMDDFLRKLEQKCGWLKQVVALVVVVCVRVRTCVQVEVRRGSGAKQVFAGGRHLYSIPYRRVTNVFFY